MTYPEHWHIPESEKPKLGPKTRKVQLFYMAKIARIMAGKPYLDANGKPDEVAAKAYDEDSATRIENKFIAEYGDTQPDVKAFIQGLL